MSAHVTLVVYRRDHDRAVPLLGTVDHPLFGAMAVIGFEVPTEPVGIMTLPTGQVDIGTLIVSAGVLALQTSGGGRPNLEPLRPYIERFIAANWNQPDADAEDTSEHVNTRMLRAGAQGTFLWDAFTHDGERYNIVSYLGQETTVMLAAEY